VKALRKGISPIIATVLLILIAIATGIVIYAFATGWIGGRLNQGSGPQAVLVVETGYWDKDNNLFVLYVRNDGGAPANITRAYITDPNGNVYYIDVSHISSDASLAKAGSGQGVIVTPGNVNTTAIYYGATSLSVQSGYAYKVTIVSTDGSEVSYTIRA